jgi:hypothetical protein
LKTWKDYWKSFCDSLGLLVSKMAQRMIFEMLGLEKSVGGGSGSGAGGLIGLGASLLKSIFGWGAGYTGGAQSEVGALLDRHSGGIVSKHGGGLQRDEVLAKLLTREYVMQRSATRSLGKTNLDYMNATGKIPGGGNNLTINVPVSMGIDDKRLQARLRANIEEVVQRTVRDSVR